MIQILNYNLLYLFLLLKFVQVKLSLAASHVVLRSSLRLSNNSFNILKSPLGSRQWAQDQIQKRSWFLNYIIYIPKRSVILNWSNLTNFQVFPFIKFFFLNLPLLSSLSFFLSIKTNVFITC